jgi:acetyl-CoA decarbonylase/synthase complex subunit epsilon
MTLPFSYVNVLTGIKSARLMESAEDCADLIKRARRPLLIIGGRTLEWSLDGRLVIEYAVDIAQAIDIPICATAHTKKKLLELGATPASSYDVVEIVNHLKDAAWAGVKKEGNHDLVIFLGIRADLGNQALSTLKHFASHLRTMTLCKVYYPHANYSLGNLKDDKWKEFLDNLIQELKKA